MTEPFCYIFWHLFLLFCADKKLQLKHTVRKGINCPLYPYKIFYLQYSQYFDKNLQKFSFNLKKLLSNWSSFKWLYILPCWNTKLPQKEKKYVILGKCININAVLSKLCFNVMKQILSYKNSLKTHNYLRNQLRWQKWQTIWIIA